MYDYKSIEAKRQDIRELIGCEEESSLFNHLLDRMKEQQLEYITVFDQLFTEAYLYPAYELTCDHDLETETELQADRDKKCAEKEDIPRANSGNIKCKICLSQGRIATNMIFYQRQTRSADGMIGFLSCIIIFLITSIEPMTIFWHCITCNHRFRQ